MIIHSKLKDYQVHIEEDLSFLNRLEIDEKTQFVIDRKVYELYTNYFAKIDEKQLMLIDATEENKVIDTVLSICEQMTNIPAKRNAVLISVGGGIIQDITGFVANILYRGIKWIFVPTTLLASCDSCIGGKTSLNYKTYKNLLGTFYPPDDIYICPRFFITLTERDFKSGLGEVVKFNLMAGDEGLIKISGQIDALLQREYVAINDAVHYSLNYKKIFIEKDEFDKGERIKLNFAHTFGHAIEVVSNYQIPHGTAVAIGMIMADSISVHRGLLNPRYAAEAEQLLLKVIDVPAEMLAFDEALFLDAISKDKKQIGKSRSAVLLIDGKDNKELIMIHDMKAEEVCYAINHFRACMTCSEGKV